MITPFMQSNVSVKCYGNELLLVETHPDIVEQKCAITAKGVMEKFPRLSFYFYMTDLLARAISTKVRDSHISNQRSL